MSHNSEQIFEQCEALTLKGERCRWRPKIRGYCILHYKKVFKDLNPKDPNMLERLIQLEQRTKQLEQEQKCFQKFVIGLATKYIPNFRAPRRFRIQRQSIKAKPQPWKERRQLALTQHRKLQRYKLVTDKRQRGLMH